MDIFISYNTFYILIYTKWYFIVANLFLEKMYIIGHIIFWQMPPTIPSYHNQTIIYYTMSFLLWAIQHFTMQPQKQMNSTWCDDKCFLKFMLEIWDAIGYQYNIVAEEPLRTIFENSQVNDSLILNVLISRIIGYLST